MAQRDNDKQRDSHNIDRSKKKEHRGPDRSTEGSAARPKEKGAKDIAEESVTLNSWIAASPFLQQLLCDACPLSEYSKIKWVDRHQPSAHRQRRCVVDGKKRV